MSSEENMHNLYQVRKQLLIETCWKGERPIRRQFHTPRFLEFLKVLVMESSVRAYIGEGKVSYWAYC